MIKLRGGVCVFALSMVACAQVLACGVPVDIWPDEDPNYVDFNRDCELLVAMLAPSAGALDYAYPETALLAPSSGLRDMGVSPLSWTWEDVNADGFTDILFVFSVPELVDAGVLTEDTVRLFLIVWGEWDLHYPDSICAYDNLCGTKHLYPANEPLTVGDLVWHDVNGNGLQEDGEPGIAGVSVGLYDEAGTLLAETTTDEFGNYMFSVDWRGTYTVVVDEETLPAGMSPTVAGAGDDPELDSNTSPATVVLDCENPDDWSIDFGYVSCGACEGQVSELSLRYLGDVADAHIRVWSKKGGWVFDGTVQPGEVFSFSGASKQGTFGSSISIWVNCAFAVSIHTSCSEPIGPGMVFGDFEVTAGASSEGGALCAGDAGGTTLCDDGKPQVLTMLYTGEGCEASNHGQDPGTVVCAGDPAGAEQVYIIATDHAHLWRRQTRVWFSGWVSLGDVFDIDAMAAGSTRLGGNTYVFVFGEGGRLLQRLMFHTSCSQPLNIGDQFGSLVLADFVAAPQGNGHWGWEYWYRLAWCWKGSQGGCRH